MSELPDRPGEPDEPDDHRRHGPDRPGDGDDTPHHSGDERWDPVVGGDQRLSSFELGRERGWLDGPDRPPRLADTRPYDEEGGLSEPTPKDQWALEEAVPKDDVGEPDRYPDVREPWFELVNDGGPDADPFRGNNCLDCSLSAISTWHGEPNVSAPRFPEYEVDGRPSKLGEDGGIERAERWLGDRYRSCGRAPDAFDEIQDKLREGGDGAAANIITAWRPEYGGGSHAWNAFNRRGEIIWADPQLGDTDDKPLYARQTDAVWYITIDREGNPL